MCRRSLLILVLVLALGACASQRCRLLATTTPVEVVERELRYVPVPARLTTLPAIIDGPPSACLDVALARRTALEQCRIQLDEIATIEGTRADD